MRYQFTAGNCGTYSVGLIHFAKYVYSSHPPHHSHGPYKPGSLAVAALLINSRLMLAS